MSDRPAIPSTLDQLTMRVQAQERQIAALTSQLTHIHPTNAQRAGRARRLGVSSAVALVLALLFGTVALAAIPGTGGVINGCYNKKDGNLRVIDAQAGKLCDKAESTLTWNQVGPQGIPGVAAQKAIGAIPARRGHPAGRVPRAIQGQKVIQAVLAHKEHQGRLARRASAVMSLLAPPRPLTQPPRSNFSVDAMSKPSPIF